MTWWSGDHDARQARRSRVTAAASLTAVAGLSLAHGAGAIATPTAARVGVAVVGAMYLGLVVSVLRSGLEVPDDAGAPPAKERRWVRERSDERDRLTGAAMLVRFSEMSAMDFYVRLRPRLANVAIGRVESAGIDRGDRVAVAAALGPLGPDLLDPALGPPAERDAPGVPATEVRDLLRRLDALT